MRKLSELEKALPINEDALNEALVNQAEAFWHVAEELAITISRRDEAKQNFEEVEAKVDLAIRTVADAKEEKTTEKQVKSRVLQNKGVIEAKKELAELSSRVGLLSALKESFLQRGYALNNLTHLHTASDYNSANSGDRNSNKLKNAQAERHKERGFRRER